MATLNAPRFFMLEAFLLALVALLSVSAAKDKYTDEDRPYEFGFNIEGQQHRHEKKDENGIIMGEFGFITADGVYHVTVYATDENGDFKIISMKNIRLGPAPEMKKASALPAARGPQGRALEFPTSAAPPPTSLPTTTKFPSIFRGHNGCGSCVVPTTVAPTLASQSLNSKGSVTSQPLQATVSLTTNQKPASSLLPPELQNGPRVFIVSDVNQFQPNQNVSPQNGGIQFLPLSPTVTYTPKFEITTRNSVTNNIKFGPQFPSVRVGTPDQQTPEALGISSGKQTPASEPNAPIIPGITIPKQVSGLKDTTAGPNLALTVPGGAVNGKNAPILTDKRIVNVQNKLNDDSPRSGKALFPPAQSEVISPLQRLRPGISVPQNGVERDGLPRGVSMKDIMDLLYKFNYTVGFHGHHESGYRNGDKEGGYFSNGRDGYGRKVEYIANEFGYQPNITLVDLGLQSPEIPKEDSEKQYGLKGYEFKWFYNR